MCPIRRHVTAPFPVPGAVNLEHWAKVESARFPHCEVMTFYLYNSQIFCEEILWYCASVLFYISLVPVDPIADSCKKKNWLWRGPGGDVPILSRLRHFCVGGLAARHSPHIHLRQHGLISMLHLFCNPFYRYLLCCSITLRFGQKTPHHTGTYILLTGSHYSPAIHHFLVQRYSQGYFLMSSWTKSQTVAQWKQFRTEPSCWDPQTLLMVLLDSRLKLKETIGNGTPPLISYKYCFF